MFLFLFWFWFYSDLLLRSCSLYLRSGSHICMYSEVRCVLDIWFLNKRLLVLTYLLTYLLVNLITYLLVLRSCSRSRYMFLLTYLLTYLPTHLLTYLFLFLFWLLTYLLIVLVQCSWRHVQLLNCSGEHKNLEKNGKTWKSMFLCNVTFAFGRFMIWYIVSSRSPRYRTDYS